MLSKHVHCGGVSGYDAPNEGKALMLTKLLTAIIGILIALMVLRHFVDRAERAKLKAQRRQAADGPAKVTTLEYDPDTGSYRPKT